MRQGSEAISLASVHHESPRREGTVRILIVDAAPSCAITIAHADGGFDLSDRVEVVRTTSAEIAQHRSDSWDVMITHIHKMRTFDSSTASRVESDELGGVMRKSAAQLAGLGRSSIFGKLFRRRKLSYLEREERRVTRTVVLSEIQREIGIALSAIEMADFDTIGEIALRLKDDGSNYNFAKLSGLGAALYDTVPSRDIRTARNIAQKLMIYMGKTIGSYTS
jgi:hypothetical protein